MHCFFTPSQDTQPPMPKPLSASKMYGSSVPPPAAITLKGAFSAASKGVKATGKSNEEEEKIKKNKKRKMCTAQFNCPHPAILSSTNGIFFYCQDCKPAGEKLKKLA